MATVKLYGNLRNYVDDSILQISGTSVRAVLDRLCEDNTHLCDHLLADGSVRPHYRIMINGHDIVLSHGLDTAICEDDQIAIFPPIAGG